MNSDKFTKQMIMVAFISSMVYGFGGSFVMRGFQENLQIFWFTFQDFACLLTGFLTMHLLEKDTVKKWVFYKCKEIRIILVSIDTLSLIVFYFTENYLQLLLVDIFLNQLYLALETIFTDVKAANLSGTDMANFSKKRTKWAYLASLIVSPIAMIVAKVFVRDQLISFEFIFAIEAGYIVWSIFQNIIYFRIYKESVKIVEEMWEADRVKKESTSKQEKIENLKSQIERLSESYGLKIKNVDIE